MSQLLQVFLASFWGAIIALFGIVFIAKHYVRSLRTAKETYRDTGECPVCNHREDSDE